jgi:hypothetical protein
MPDIVSDIIICKVHTDVWNRYDIIDLETLQLVVANWRQLTCESNYAICRWWSTTSTQETFNLPFGHNLTDKVT